MRTILCCLIALVSASSVMAEEVIWSTSANLSYRKTLWEFERNPGRELELYTTSIGFVSEQWFVPFFSLYEEVAFGWGSSDTRNPGARTVNATGVGLEFTWGLELEIPVASPTEDEDDSINLVMRAPLRYGIWYFAGDNDVQADIEDLTFRPELGVGMSIGGYYSMFRVSAGALIDVALDRTIDEYDIFLVNRGDTYHLEAKNVAGMFIEASFMLVPLQVYGRLELFNEYRLMAGVGLIF